MLCTPMISRPHTIASTNSPPSSRPLWTRTGWPAIWRLIQVRKIFESRFSRIGKPNLSEVLEEFVNYASRMKIPTKIKYLYIYLKNLMRQKIKCMDRNNFGERSQSKIQIIFYILLPIRVPNDLSA